MRRFIITLILGAVVISLSGMTVQAQDDTAQANKAIVRNAVAEANAGNWEAIYNLFPEQFQMNQGDENLYDMSRDDVIGYNEALLGAMPDLQLNADVLIAQGDWVATELVFTGTFTEPLNFFGQEAPPTNEVVSWTEMDFWRFEDGVIVESWGVSDPTVQFSQLGMMESPFGEEEDPETPLELPAGYQTLSAEELAASYVTDMAEQNTQNFQDHLGAGLGVDDSEFYAEPYMSWNNGQAYERTHEDLQGDVAFTQLLATAMPDYVIETPIVVAEGDWVASLVRVVGTFTEDIEFFGTPLTATGEPVVWQLGIIDRYNAEGKIVEDITETDPLSLFGALGLISLDDLE